MTQGCNEKQRANGNEECHSRNPQEKRSVLRHHRSNEKELSHRWRKRALLRSLISKASKSYSSERPAVGWSDWLGPVRSIRAALINGSSLASPVSSREPRQQRVS